MPVRTPSRMQWDTRLGLTAVLSPWPVVAGTVVSIQGLKAPADYTVDVPNRTVTLTQDAADRLGNSFAFFTFDFMDPGPDAVAADQQAVGTLAAAIKQARVDANNATTLPQFKAALLAFEDGVIALLRRLGQRIDA